MPIYCYVLPNGVVHEEFFPIGKAPAFVKVKGKKAERSMVTEQERSSQRSGEGAWPREFWASSVPKHLVDQARKAYPDRTYNSDGKLIVKSMAEQNRICKQDGLVEMNSQKKHARFKS